jgi:hypothetical protein
MAVIATRVTVALACAVVMAGCAGRSPTQPAALTSTPLSPTATAPSYTTPTSTVSPTYGSTAPLTGLPGQVGTSPSGSLGYASNGAYSVQDQSGMAGTLSTQAPLTARISSKKNGVFLGMGTFKVTVAVTNAGTVAQSGTLKVSITDKGKVLKDFSERVTVQPGQTLNKDYEDKRWKADNATVSVTTDAADPSLYGGTTGY